MSLPHWKPKPRTRSSEALRAFRLQNAGEPCERCERRPGCHVHHRVFRSQGGNDEPENFEWVCIVCHGELHGIRVVE